MIAGQLRSLHSLGAYHTGMLPPGGESLPKEAPFTLDPPLPETEFRPLKPVTGALLGTYGRAKGTRPTHVLVVNLDYEAEQTFRLRGPGLLEVFDPATGKWTATGGRTVELQLAGGAGKLVRLRR